MPALGAFQDPTVGALARDIRHLQEQLAAVPLVHAAVLSGGTTFHDALWGPRCHHELLWSVPLISESMGPSPLVTCPECIAARPQ